MNQIVLAQNPLVKKSVELHPALILDINLNRPLVLFISDWKRGEVNKRTIKLFDDKSILLYIADSKKPILTKALWLTFNIKQLNLDKDIRFKSAALEVSKLIQRKTTLDKISTFAKELYNMSQSENEDHIWTAAEYNKAVPHLGNTLLYREKQIEQLEKAQKDIKKEMEKAKNENNKLKAENVKLNQENATLKEGIDLRDQEIDELSVEKDELQENVVGLTAENAGLRKQVEKLRKRL